jgi:hypothetical protein
MKVAYAHAVTSRIRSKLDCKNPHLIADVAQQSYLALEYQ